MKSILKIILYLILIAVIGAVIYGLYVKLSDADFSSVSDTVSGAFSSVSSWFAEKLALLS